MGNFSSEVKRGFLDRLRQNNITLMASVGGANSFGGFFNNIWTNPNSKYHIDGNNIKTIEQSTMLFAQDLVDILNDLNIDAVDLDIEGLSTDGTYMNTPNYLGYMSKYLKNPSQGSGMKIVTHASTSLF